MTTIVTPRPPLNEFKSVRVVIDDTWTEIYQVPEYEIPASGPNPSRTVKIAGIMTGILITNTGTDPIQASVRVVGVDTNNYLVMNKATVPPNDFMLLSLERQVLETDEVLEMKCEEDQGATVHFSLVLNSKEEYEVIT
jgi:hypothetical protein